MADMSENESNIELNVICCNKRKHSTDIDGETFMQSDEMVERVFA